jgi:CBS domain-containing protein
MRSNSAKRERKPMKVSEIMSHPVITVREDATLEEVARIMLDHKFGSVPVVNEQGTMIGLITESDFAAKGKGVPFTTFEMPQVFGHWLGKSGVEQMYERARTILASDTMTRDVITVEENATIEEVLELMLLNDVNRIPVLRNKVPVGIAARYDLLKLMLQERK